uniref:Uncharacterized protein MANES_03G122400 n=1 Tax=Rhizophora mucronata TaxID=61149 RepID=A0A2P2Q3A4_RHIMU
MEGLTGDMDIEDLKRCKCGAGARISLPTWRLMVEGEIELMWGGLIELRERSAGEWCTTCGVEPCKLAGGGEFAAVCKLHPGPAENKTAVRFCAEGG